MEPLPHQDALAKIGRAVVTRQPSAVAMSDVGTDAPEDLLTLVSLTRLASGDATLRDAAALATTCIARMLPNATCVFFLSDPPSGHLIARYATGEHAHAMRGMAIRIGDRLSGWVASCRQTIMNSDGALDLYDRGLHLRSALSTPLRDGDTVIGVFTAYLSAPSAFTDDQSRLVEMMAPHVGRLLGAVLDREQHRNEHHDARPLSSVNRDLRLVACK